MTFQSGNNVTEINIVSVAAAAVLVLAYVGIYQGLTGRTVGKRVTGLRVINRDGSVINVRRSLLRFFSLVVVDAGASAFMVGLATCLATRGHRRVGDMWARTFVVTERAVGHPIFLPPRLEAAYWDSERGAHMRWDMFAGRYLMWDPTSGTWT